MAKLLDNNVVLCEQCGNEYSRIGSHWAGESCNHPKLNDVTKDALIGLLMSDGTIDTNSRGNGRMKIKMISHEFLKFIDDEFGWLSTGPKLEITAEENAEMSKLTGFTSAVNVENYHDMYRLRTRNHPFISSLANWYSSGSKTWPANIDMTPTVLMMLYVGDGTYSDTGGNRRITISMRNEICNKDKVEGYFTSSNIPAPSSWNNGGPQWTVENSYKLFGYMTKSPLWEGPPPGFEYKFPENFGGFGKSMADLDEQYGVQRQLREPIFV